ncbi:MAG: DUF748 domain-containing protein [Pseudomonadota bacterium]
MIDRLPSRQKFWLKWVLGAYLAYVAVAFLLIMPLLNVFVPKTIEEASNRRFESELLFFNPFTIALDFRGLALEESDLHRPVEVDRIEANLSLASLWRSGIVFDEISVEGLHLRVLRYADGRFHFDDLLAEGGEEGGKQSDTSPIPHVTVNRLAINAKELTYTDQTRPQPYTTTQRDLNLATKNISTKPNTSGDGVFELTSDGGGRLAWTGTVDIAGSASRGRLELSNIDLTHAWRYQKHELSVVLGSALLDATVLYDVNWQKELALSLTDSQLRLHDVSVQPKYRHQTGVSDLPSEFALSELALSQLRFDLQEKDLLIGAVRFSGLDADVYDRNGVFSLNDYLPQGDIGTLDVGTLDGSGAGGESSTGGQRQEAENTPAAKQAQTSPSGTDTTPEAEWNLTLQKLTLNDNRVGWNTEYLSPGEIEVTPIEFSIEGLAYPAPSTALFSGQLVINQKTTLTFSGDLIANSGELNGELAINTLPLTWFNPPLNEATRTDIRSGTLSSNVNVLLNNFEPRELLIDLNIADFATELHETRATAFELAQLKLSKMRLKPEDASIEIASLELLEPVGSLHVLEDGRLNINGVIRETDNKEVESTSTAATSSGAAPNKLATTDGAGKKSEAPVWGLRLDEFSIDQGRLDFADDSLPLPFQANIAEIRGRLTDLNTRDRSPLALELLGSVDGYAPVSIKAEGIYAEGNRDLNFTLDFSGVDIANMTPYSGTYAGYEIKSGTMNVNLSYGLQEESLAGTNRILIAQMELGDRIESDKALNLPLKLALALLTDSSGVIDVSVPVSGSVDDPSFSLGGVIGRAITNLIVNAAAAPFKLLAGLVGSKQDLEDIAFPIGSKLLDQNGRESLDALAKALEQRPGLSIRISGSYDPLSDTRSLQEASLEAELAANGFSELAIARRDKPIYEHLLARFGPVESTNEQAMKDKLQSSVNTPSESNSIAPSGAQTSHLWDKALASVIVEESALQGLASARATSAKRFLVTEKALSPERISVSASLDQDFAGVHMRIAQ